METAIIDIKRNYEDIRNRMEKACKSSDRLPEEVTLIAVSKTKPIELLKEAYSVGCREFGENKVQELMDKIPQMPEDVKWHMIGHLQTNKVKYIIGKVELIHSVDSLKLAKEISKESLKHNVVTNILIEINVAGEESKFGTADMNANLELIKEIQTLPGIAIKGLMTIAPFTENPDENSVYFRSLKSFAQEHKDLFDGDIILSMGMSGDYEAAIQEGATMVRVGTNLFGARNYSIMN